MLEANGRSKKVFCVIMQCQPGGRSQTHFIGDHDDLLAVQALQDGTALVTDTEHFNVGIGGKLSANVTNNTSVHGTAQS
jgi:hypothetical protein